MCAILIHDTQAWWNGRHAGLRSQCLRVRVQVPPPAPENDKFRQKLVVFSYIRLTAELYAPSVRDICFASDMPAGIRGEYNITLLQYLAYGEVCKAYHILRSKIYHSVEDGISLKTNG